MKIRAITPILALGLAFAMVGCARFKNDDDKSNQAEGTSQGSGDVVSNASSVVSKISGDSYIVEKTFDGPEGSGLIGLVLEPRGGVGSKQIGWASSDGRFVTPGPLFNSNGDNLNESALVEHGGLLTAEELATRIVEGNMGFVAGKRGPVLTVFFEPYCGFCNRLFDELKPRIDKGEMRVRFLMVSFLRPDSAARGADIAFAKDPYKALTDWERIKDKASAPAPKGNPERERELYNHVALFNEANLGGTPASIMCNKQTGELEIIRGFPPNLGELIANIGEEGHAICKG